MPSNGIFGDIAVEFLLLFLNALDHLGDIGQLLLVGTLGVNIIFLLQRLVVVLSKPGDHGLVSGFLCIVNAVDQMYHNLAGVGSSHTLDSPML